MSGLPHFRFASAAALLALVILLSRIPFLGAGYGLHADNWRTALAARHIAESGVYEASRLPGYPVQEYVCSWLWKTGPLGFNALDAVFCIAGCVCFAGICRDYGCRQWWLPALALAFAPIVYVNSVSSKDFLWASAFLMAAWWCAMRKRPLATGLLLGLAIGVRITSGAALLPMALILVEGLTNRQALGRLLLTGGTAVLLGVAAFTPVYWRYGWGFFDFYAQHAFPTPLTIAWHATVETWGVLGVIGLVAAFASAPVQRRTERPTVPPRHRLAWALMVFVFFAAFLSLPHEGAYLIPALPFILLLGWYFAMPVVFRIACGLIILSPFVGWSGGKVVAGDVIQDHRDRLQTNRQIDGFLSFAATLSGSNAFIVGSWAPPIEWKTQEHPPANAKFSYLLTKGELEELEAKGWRVWYLPLMREFDARVYHFDVARYGARDVRSLQPRRP